MIKLFFYVYAFLAYNFSIRISVYGYDFFALRCCEQEMINACFNFKEIGVYISVKLVKGVRRDTNRGT